MRKVLFFYVKLYWWCQISVNAMDQHQVPEWADFCKQMQVPEQVVEHVPLLEAAEKGDLQQVRALLDGGIDVNLRDRRGNTPLHKAVLHSHPAVVKLLLECVLITQGALDYCQYHEAPEVKIKRSLDRLMKGHDSQPLKILSIEMQSLN